MNARLEEILKRWDKKLDPIESVYPFLRNTFGYSPEEAIGISRFYEKTIFKAYKLAKKYLRWQMKNSQYLGK